MHKKILSIILALGLFFTFVPFVSAAVQGPSSCATETVFVYLYENSTNDTSDNNDILVHCANSDTNLHNTDHTLPGNCHAAPISQVTWGNCVSSVNIWAPDSVSFCGYDLTNYHTLIVNVKGTPGSRINILSDKLGSFRFINTGPGNVGCPAT